MQVQRQIDRLLAQRAAEWLETLKSGDERDRAAFVEWLRQSKLHVEQYLEMVAIDRELQRLDPAQGEDVAELLKRIAPNIIELKRPGGGRMQVAAASGRRKFLRIGVAVAAGIALCSVTLLWRFDGGRSRGDFATAIGEQRTLTLSDGSVVTLNVASEIKVDFSSGARVIHLKSGEAVFKVAHDVARPFVVHTSTANVRAVGTQFNVDQRPDGTVVSVLEGRVQVTALAQNLQGSPIPKPTIESLNAGEQARVQPNGRIEMRAHADVNKAIAWRQRRLVFEETPLEDIVREFNSYGPPMQLKIEGIEPGSRRYGGIFDADDPNSLADLLSQEPDLSVERRDREIIVRKR
jgi:transmembrane sensor